MSPESVVRGRYELEITIERPVEHVWTAMTQSVNEWWLPSFRMTGGDAVVSLDPTAGGQLIERSASGASLLWATVTMVVPNDRILFAGHHFPAWGGPSVSFLEWQLETVDVGTCLKVSDQLIGTTSEAGLQSLRDGWKELFSDGLKSYCVQ